MANKVNQLSNNNYMVVLLLVTLLALGGAGLVGKMLIGTILHDTKVVSAKDKAAKQLQKDLDAAPQLVDAYKQLGSKQTLIADALPTEADLPTLMAMFENMAGVSGLSMKSISPDQTVTNAASAGIGGTATTNAAPTTDANGVPTPQKYGFAVAFDGNYQSLLKLLTAMEQSARPTRVTTVQLSGTGGNLAIQMSGTTYYQDKATLPIKTETIK